MTEVKGSGESPENGEIAHGGEPSAAGKGSGILIEDTVSGKIFGPCFIDAWKKLLLQVI